MKSTKKIKKESLKRFDVEVNFFEENIGFSDDWSEDSISFSCEGYSKDRDKVVLSGLISEIINMTEKGEDFDDVCIRLPLILEFAKSSKNIESFRKKICKELVERNWIYIVDDFRYRCGERLSKKAVSDMDWEDSYGCNFVINEVDIEEEKIELEKRNRKIENLKLFIGKLKNKESKLSDKSSKLIEEAQESKENHDELIETILATNKELDVVRNVIKKYQDLHS